MSGYRSDRLRHRCSRSGCFLDQQSDWTELAAAFPRGIRPTDVDAMVEMGGNFLFLEGKKFGAGFDSEGQRRALKALSRKGSVTVVCVRDGKPGPVQTEYEILVFRNGDCEKGWQKLAKSDLVQYLSSWAERADRNPAPDLAQQVRDLQEEVSTLQYENTALKYLVDQQRNEGRSAS